MREFERADAHRGERAEAAASLQRSTDTSTDMWMASRFAVDLPGHGEKKIFQKKIFHGDKKDLLGEKKLPPSPPEWTKESCEPTWSVVTDSKQSSSSEAKADKTSASDLISKVLENPRKTRGEILNCLKLVSDLHIEAAAREIQVVEAAREARFSWTEIATAQQFSSRQAAIQRYNRLKEGILSLLDEKAGDSEKPPS